MKNLSSWLIAIFAFAFWGFRVVETVLHSMGQELALAPMNTTMEIALLFITFLCICFIPKRKILPVGIYLITHLFYYGMYIYQNVIGIINNTAPLSIYMDLFVALIGVIIPVAAFFDVLLDKSRKANPMDKKTDWFYKNKDYDRKLDERADKNQYRTL